MARTMVEVINSMALLRRKSRFSVFVMKHFGAVQPQAQVLSLGCRVIPKTGGH